MLDFPLATLSMSGGMECILNNYTTTAARYPANYVRGVFSIFAV